MYKEITLLFFFAYIAKKVGPWIFKTWKINKVLRKFSLPVKYIWPVGHLAAYPGPNQEGLLVNLKWTELKPRMFTIYITSFKPILALVHPDTVKVLLQTAEPKPTSAVGAYKLVSPWLGNGLLISSGQTWSRNRKLLTPGFHFNILKANVVKQNDCAGILVDKLQNLSAGGDSVEITQLVSACTLDIVIKCLFSSEYSLQLKDEDQYLNTVEGIKSLIVKRAYNPIMYIDAIYNHTKNSKRLKKLVEISHRQAMQTIQQRRQFVDIGQNDPASEVSAYLKSSRCMDFLDILLLAKDEDGIGLSDKEILDEVETFKFEGHDTSSSGLYWAIYNLAKHVKYQKKVQMELDSILSDRDSSFIGYDDIKNLAYLTMCIKESLRMYPPVPLICRELKSPLVIDGVNIPSGAFVDVPIWNLHHNPTVWGEDHMEYNPERFSTENISKIDPFAFIPFSAGPRNCIGQNFAMNDLVIILGQILRNFDIRIDETHEVRMVPGLILDTENGIKVYFYKRIV